MTAKQKANQLRFKKVVAEASKLRKKNPKLTQAQAVKKAWSLIKPKKIGNVKITKYKGYTIEKSEDGYKVLNPQGFDDVGQYLSSLKMAKEHIDDSLEDSIGKIKRKKSKKSTIKKFHKDTKSHNVNIRVVSGVKKKLRKKVAKKKIATKKQTGTSVKAKDKLYQAKAPGKRTTKWGTTYYESRANRSDKGVLLGIEYHTIRLNRINNDVNGNPRYVCHFLEFLNAEESNTIKFKDQYAYALKKARLLGGKKFHNKQYGGGIVFQSYNTNDLKERIAELREIPIAF